MDWKDFLIQNPWAPPRYLKERFPDFDNMIYLIGRKKIM